MNLKFLESSFVSTSEEEAACSKNEESLHDYCERIAFYFDVNHPDECIIDAEAEFSIATARKLYGLAWQGLHGDQWLSEPSWINIKEHMKWVSWEAERGKSLEEACGEFLELAIPLLEE